MEPARLVVSNPLYTRGQFRESKQAYLRVLIFFSLPIKMKRVLLSFMTQERVGHQGMLILIIYSTEKIRSRNFILRMY